ncbi:MAG TPA: fucose isomerase [Armatimonadetes bacterium]|nr:fucose isomerase [Armatimonadota bacterium]
MKIGICTFTDGRKRVADSLRDDCFHFQRAIADWLRGEGHEVLEAQEIIWNYATARSEAGRLADAGCEVTIFNFCVWSFPDLTAQAALLTPSPILFVGNINPAYPGWVAFFASAGTLDEIGQPFGRVLGGINDPAVQEGIRRFLERHDPDRRRKGQEAAARLRGLRYGEFDGPSMGMYTGHLDQSQWMSQFGIHVYHRGQLHLANLTETVADERVEAGLQWLEEHCAAIHWDSKMLTPGLDGTLARQVRLYLAIKDFCREEGIDFCGLTGQLDFTESPQWCTMDVPEALLNDTADWEEENKKPLICATECDSNGALTMQILHHLTGTPVLFADLRHYHADRDVYDLVNSGEHAPWFAKRSDDWRENWAEVHLQPASEFYFRGGGASVQFYAAPADQVTFARLTRKNGYYRMHIFTGSFLRFTPEEDENLARQTTYEWPHAFAKFDCSVETLAQSYSANHIHAVVGDYLAELIAACEFLDIEPIVLS